MTKTPSTDNSVQFALAELEALESARVQAETEAAEARRAAEAEAERQAAEAAERARQQEQARLHREAILAREKAKLDVDAEVDARTAEGDRKMAAMRAELERIRAERALIHDRMLAGTEMPERPARHWPVVAGVLGAVASVLGVLLFVQATTPPPAPEVIVREVHVPIAPAEPMEESPEPAVEAEPEPVAEVAPEPEPERRPVRPRPRPTTHEAALDRMNDCGDDPLCGLD